MQFDDDVSQPRNDFKDDFAINLGNGASKDSNFESNFNIEPLYDGEEADGFDKSNGSEWIYPTNYPVRKYQRDIVSNALFKNTLVCLPTGLGKTFIAAVVMYNYHRWYPKHIVVFMAHSKPLVAQQVNACCNIMGISPSSIAELNGNMLHSNRKKQWETKKIFFLTPQVFNNDLARGSIKAESIRCLVIDEAHKALGNQAYCQVIRSIRPFNSKFRVLALSATPGDDMNMVREVIQNLMISHLELHNEDDPEIKPYLHKKKIETVVVILDKNILEVKDLFLQAVQKYVKPLIKNMILPQSYSSVNPFSLVLKQRQFMQNPKVPPELRGLMLSNFAVAISLFHAMEELITYGLRSFVTKLKCLQSGEGSSNKAHHRIANDNDIKSLIEHVENILGPDNNVSFDVNSSLTRIFDEIDSIDPGPNVVYSHPKFAVLEKVIQEHFDSHTDSTRVIVFCKSRQCTGEICNFLARFRPLVKPMIFIGQSQTSSGIVTRGFNQAAQLTVMKRFREGVYNTLVATCVAEEGLDIGEVDLIVNFDSGKNSNTQVQRSGRTGRKRDGRVVNLVTEGKEQHNYNISVSKGKKMSKQLAHDSTKLPFYTNNPRLIPEGFDPICQEMYLTAKKIVEQEPKGRKRKNKGTNSKTRRDTFEDGDRLNKRKKRSENDTENINLWTVVADKNLKEEGNNSEDKRKGNTRGSGGKLSCIELEVDSTLGQDVDNLRHESSPCEIEIIEREENEDMKMLLYNDDVKEKTDKPWESLSMDESQEKNLIVQFLKSNNLGLNSKIKFKNMFDLRKYRKYLKPNQKSDVELMSKMNAVMNYELSEFDFECLRNDELDVQTLAKLIVESRKRIFINKLAKSDDFDIVDKENEDPKDLFGDEVNITDDIDQDEFLRPFEPCYASSSKPTFTSSTPLRKRDEKSVLKTIGNPLASDSDFYNLDENHFFNIKDRSSPKNEGNILTEKGCSVKKDPKDLSMLSITQAIDIVNKATSNDCDIESKLCEKSNKSFLASSPILFLSQRSKPVRNKSAPTSPILTQKTGNKRSSRKCLNFKESFTSTVQQSVKETGKSKLEIIEDFDSSDLFAETEFALRNHMLDAKENIKDIGNNVTNMEDETQAISRDCCNSSNETQDYDMGELSFDQNGTVNDAALKRNSKTVCERNNTHSDLDNSIENNLGTEDETHRDDEYKSSQSCFSLFWNNPSKEQSDLSKLKTNEKLGPKMAVVTPMGFENAPKANGIGEKIVKDFNDNSKLDETPFTCNFSVFGHDDFNDGCTMENKMENMGNSAVENQIKLDVDSIRNDELSDSEIFLKKELYKNDKLPVRIQKEPEEIVITDDEDLSEGTLEALKAVELYEKNENPQKSASSMKNFDLDSDNSDEFFLPKRRRANQVNISENEQSKKKVQPRKKSKQDKPSVKDFIQMEAEISDLSKVSSDEENTSGLDEYDSSFVDEREMLTQAQDVDMTAKYLQSTKSATAIRQGTLKIPKVKIKQQLNVFSQIGSEGESEYENDSFCVSGEEISEFHEMSELELAEIVLKHKRKRKKIDVSEIDDRKKKQKFKRVLRIESESSENEVEALTELSKNDDKLINASDIEEILNSPFAEETEAVCSPSNVENISAKPVIFVACRQIASAPEITTVLRAKWNANIQVRSSPEADYIVSWRVGICRIQLSDFVSGSPGAKNNLKEIMTKLSGYFKEQVLIVEDDKNKGLPNTTGYNKNMWSKYSGRNLVKIMENDVKVIFSRSKDDTARILILLYNEERSKGQTIDLTSEIDSEFERKMKFYNSLPGVNIANALRMSSKFSSIASFLKCCDSVQIIMAEIGLKKEDAVKLYQLMFLAPDC